MPERIQLQRTKGWRKPEGAIVVARPTKWGNPIRITPERGEVRGRVMYRVHGSPLDISCGPSYNLRDTAQHFATMFFKWDLLNGRFGAAYPSVEDIHRELAGRDLACWCPLVDSTGRAVPCHADVLLDLAQADEEDCRG